MNGCWDKRNESPSGKACSYESFKTLVARAGQNETLKRLCRNLYLYNRVDYRIDKGSRWMDTMLQALARCVGLARGLPCSDAAEVQAKSLSIEGTQGTPSIGMLGGDEKAFVAAAIQHKVARSALSGLSLLGIGLSEKGRAALRMSAHASALRAALAALDAVKITEALARDGIASAVIKGPAAALQLYENLDTREFYDLDIVANIQEASEVIPLMRELGFEPDVRAVSKIASAAKAGKPGKSAKPNPIAKRLRHISFSHPAKPFRVELHDRGGWEAEAFGHDDFDALFSRIVMLEVTMGDKLLRFPSLSLADHALLLIAHGSHHAWCLLHWLLDAAAILAHNDSSFQEEFAAKIPELGMGRKAKVVCSLIQRFYPVKIPAPLARIIDDEKKNLDGAVRYALSRLETGGRDLGTFRHKLALPMFYLAPQLKEAHQKWKVIFAPFKIPKDDLEAFPLPRALAFLYLPLRPFFVIARRRTQKR